jgi:hypothetical protein
MCDELELYSFWKINKITKGNKGWVSKKDINIELVK